VSRTDVDAQKARPAEGIVAAFDLRRVGRRRWQLFWKLIAIRG
jgi:hypothetical protein